MRTFQIVENKDELADCLEIRRVVFIVGQNVPEEEEMDGREDDCRHYLGRVDGVPMATARVMPLEKTAKIQRVAVMEEARGTGLGAELMRFLLDDCRGRFETAVLGSQVQAIGFYERLGFKVQGPVFLDAGIEHREMVLTL